MTNERDPIFLSSPAASITYEDIISWNNKSTFSGSYLDLQDRPDNVIIFDLMPSENNAFKFLNDGAVINVNDKFNNQHLIKDILLNLYNYNLQFKFNLYVGFGNKEILTIDSIHKDNSKNNITYVFSSEYNSNYNIVNNQLVDLQLIQQKYILIYDQNLEKLFIKKMEINTKC